MKHKAFSVSGCDCVHVPSSDLDSDIAFEEEVNESAEVH